MPTDKEVLEVYKQITDLESSTHASRMALVEAYRLAALNKIADQLSEIDASINKSN